ncbi:hypothetical protein ACIHAX_35595 [Nocardia sp. NPDC051929]|uniref:hypothetical protein n=1 Tax=unclassified Nocardia TaxID=2637762 RepID=UPI003421EEFD
MVVPNVRHLTGCLDAVRRDHDVWTLAPPSSWPRNDICGTASDFIANSGRF